MSVVNGTHTGKLGICSCICFWLGSRGVGGNSRGRGPVCWGSAQGAWNTHLSQVLHTHPPLLTHLLPHESVSPGFHGVLRHQRVYFQTIIVFTTARNKSQQTLMVAILWRIKLIYAYNQTVFPLIIYAQQFNIIICATISTFLPSWLSTLEYKHTHRHRHIHNIQNKKTQYPSEAGFLKKINVIAASFVFCCDKTEFKQPRKSKQQEKYQYILT